MAISPRTYLAGEEERLKALLEEAIGNFGPTHQEQVRRSTRRFFHYLANVPGPDKPLLLRSFEHCIRHYDGGLRDTGHPALLHPLELLEGFITGRANVFKPKAVIKGGRKVTVKRRKGNPYKTYLAAAILEHDEREENKDDQRDFLAELLRRGLITRDGPAPPQALTGESLEEAVEDVLRRQVKLPVWPWPWGLPTTAHDPYYEHRLKDAFAAYPSGIEPNQAALHKWINLLKNIRRDSGEEDYIRYLGGAMRDKVQTRNTPFDEEQQQTVALLKWGDRGHNGRSIYFRLDEELSMVLETREVQYNIHSLIQQIESDKYDHFHQARAQGLPASKVEALGKDWASAFFSLRTVEGNLRRLERLMAQIDAYRDLADDGVIPAYDPFKMNWEILKNNTTISMIRTTFKFSRHLAWTPPLLEAEAQTLAITIEAAQRNQSLKARHLMRLGYTQADLDGVERLAQEYEANKGFVARTSSQRGGPPYAIFHGTVDEIFALKHRLRQNAAPPPDPLQLYRHGTLLKVWGQWLKDHDNTTRLEYRTK